MERESEMQVRFFKTETGKEPVRDWLKSFSSDEKKTIGTDIRTVQVMFPIGKPLVDHLGGGLWEIRSRLTDTIVRVIFMVSEGEMILLHGFTKKQQKTPKDDLKLAQQRKRQYEK
jgi:phage-related protein